MDDDKKVFSSDIVRGNHTLKNNLYELLRIVPAKPLSSIANTNLTCDFVPKTDKHYVPKKKFKLKVKTVRNVREQLETDIYTELNSESEKQRNILLRKIRVGSAREEATKKIAKNILNDECPVSKDVWHMVINLNPEDHAFPSQYVLWNGKSIQINGSKGGKSKYICKYDLGKIKLSCNNKILNKRSDISNKKNLLKNSFHVKFKPGPLSKKKYLDTSYQKFQCGNATIVNLPRPALDIQPSYGGHLGPQMTTFLNETFMRNSNGDLTKQWAEFSVSVLGRNNRGCPEQVDKNALVTFDLAYKCSQNRILMRNFNDDVELSRETSLRLPMKVGIDISVEIENVMSKMLDYVEFNLDYDNHVKEEDNDYSDRVSDKITRKLTVTSRDKAKRRCGELDRLDVTVIKLPGKYNDDLKSCGKSYCKLGCICYSLEFPYMLKTHCGRTECMFECRCNFSKTSNREQIFPEFLDLDNKLSKLAKEEQKFRQTVVLSGEGTIVMNSQKRDWKASKKYADFYSRMCLKTETKVKKQISIVTPKLNCSNIEPWCMVHNLYKCFCKGKFVERAVQEVVENKSTEDIAKVEDIIPLTKEVPEESVKSRLRVRSRLEINRENNESTVEVVDTGPATNEEETETCTRVTTYKGRKYSDNYYFETNKKISEMEKNDRSLLRKLISLSYVNEEVEIQTKKDEDHGAGVSQSPASLKELLNNVVKCKNVNDNSESSTQMLPAKGLPGNTKLVAWFEASYQKYKNLDDQSITKASLTPPKLGKVALYPWKFILSRYREHKNLFLITKQKPFRILMAINAKSPFFDNCININDIPPKDIDDYPITVKNLLTNATDLKENFCILCGLSYCWELIGTVMKVSEINQNDIKSSLANCQNESLNSDDSARTSALNDEDHQESCDTDTLQETDKSINEETPKIDEDPLNKKQDTDFSKWFVMTVENDFNEMHFREKGFFTKYESVIKAIQISRLTGKTVRLSSKFCNIQTVPQFGIYAIPNKTDLNLFIGPYERHEDLGIETVKTGLPRDNTRKTRGTWIMLDKVDNVKLIDQPLAFLPSSDSSNEMISIENETTNVMAYPENYRISVESYDSKITGTTKEQNDEGRKKGIVKMIKPIKVKSSNVFKPILKPKLLKDVTSKKSNVSKSNTVNKIVDIVNLNNNEKGSVTSCTSTKPVAEIAPQIKVCEQKKEPNPSSSTERGMFILKPDEINKRSLLKRMLCLEKNSDNESSDTMEMDIDNFLVNSPVCEPPTDVLVISDDEDDEPGNANKNVWLQASNIESLGWIPAKRNNNNQISFEFPGFKYTEFYSEEEAFRKLNLVFSRKVYVPKYLKIQWEVVENQSELRSKQKLRTQDLRPDHVMTKKGLRDKHHLMRMIKLKRKQSQADCDSEEFIKRRKLFMQLEDIKSKKLEDDNLTLLNETIAKKGVIIRSLNGANETLRRQMSEKLNSLLSDTDSE